MKSVGLVLLRLAIGLLSLAGLLLLMPVNGANAPGVVVMEVNQDIDAGVADFVQRIVDSTRPGGERSGAQHLLLQLNTNGGFLAATEGIVDALSSSPIPTATFVGPAGARAFSAGTFIAMATPRIYMAEGTTLGAATPRPADPKVVMAMAGWMRSLAERHGRDPELAERFVTQALTVTAAEARAKGFAVAVVSSLEDVLADLRLPRMEREQAAPDLRARILSLLNDPVVTWLFFILGFIFILFDLIHPTFIAGPVGAALIIMAFFGLGIIGVTPLIIGLFLAGAAGVLLELYTGHGLGALGGVVLSLIGLALIYRLPSVTFLQPELPQYVFISVVVVVVGFAAVYLQWIRRALRMRGAVHDLRNLLGQTGVVKTAILPTQTRVVLVASDLWTAVAEGPIGEGTRIRVTGVEGLKLKVEPLPASTP